MAIGYSSLHYTYVDPCMPCSVLFVFIHMWGSGFHRLLSPPTIQSDRMKRMCVLFCLVLIHAADHPKISRSYNPSFLHAKDDFDSRNFRNTKHVAFEAGITTLETNCDGDDPNKRKEPAFPFYYYILGIGKR